MEDKKYSLGGFTFDTQQEYERAKVELQVILKIKQKYDINNPEDAKNVLDAVNKKGDVFKSSVGKAFINKLKRVSKNENEIHVQKPVPEQKVRYKQEEKGQDRVIIPIIAEGKKKSDIKYHIIFFMFTLLAICLNIYIAYHSQGIILTKEGKEEKLKLVELKNYINDYSLIRNRDLESVIIWDKYLAYATAFGIPNKITNSIYEKWYNLNINLQVVEKILS